MLYEQKELYTKLTGEDANNISIGYLGAYLDGYERGKADMVAMLKELKNEIIELPSPQREPEYLQGYSCCQVDILDNVIQQKINKLKEDQEGEE